MFSQQRISLFIIVLGLLIAIGTGLKAHRLHDPKKPDLNFTSSAEISCNIDGYTFTHTRETYSDGVVYTDGWWRRPLDPEVTIKAETHGAGWAHVLFYGNIDGTAKGDATNPTSNQLGSWVGFLPVGAALDREVGGEFDGSFNSTPKTYSWNASGSIKLVPVYWKWRISGITPGGSWEEASSDFHRTGTDSDSGSWTVNTNFRTLNRASPGNRDSDETSSSSSSSGCANNPNYNNWCTDTGTCTTRSPLGIAGECGHNYCCCAPSGSPTYNGNSNPPSTPTSSTPDSDSSSSDSSSSDSSSSDSSSSDSSDEGSTFVGCGHTPSHTTVNFWGCGHSGFRCEAGDHGFVYCPTSDGKTCTVSSGRYQKCRPHTHTYD